MTLSAPGRGAGTKPKGNLMSGERGVLILMWLAVACFAFAIFARIMAAVTS